MPESYVPTEELIKSGELSGRSALEYLQQTRLYAFHGSAFNGQELLPHQSRHNGQPDGQPAVAASTGIDAPIVRSLINRSRYLKDVQGMQSAWTGINGLTYFLALEDIYKSIAEEDTGYVHALPLAQNHDIFRGEVRFPQSINPDFTIETSKADLPPVITWADFKDGQPQLSSTNFLITFPTVKTLQDFYNTSKDN